MSRSIFTSTNQIAPPLCGTRPGTTQWANHIAELQRLRLQAQRCGALALVAAFQSLIDRHTLEGGNDE